MESDRKKQDTLKNRLYELQMQNKDVDFKITSIKDRILQAYKIDLDAPSEPPQEADKNALSLPASNFLRKTSLGIKLISSYIFSTLPYSFIKSVAPFGPMPEI